jgi:hypothetical protein
VIGRDSFWDFAANSDPGSFLSHFFAEIERFDSSSNVSVLGATSLQSSVFLISPMRIRTLRVTPGRCFPEGFNAANLSYLFDDSISCHPNFVLEKESTMDYGVGQKFSWSQDPLFARSLLGDFGELAYYPSGGFSVDVVADVPYSIPTPDHVLAAKNVLVIEDYCGLVDVIPYSHIRRISFAATVAP